MLSVWWEGFFHRQGQHFSSKGKKSTESSHKKRCRTREKRGSQKRESGGPLGDHTVTIRGGRGETRAHLETRKISSAILSAKGLCVPPVGGLPEKDVHKQCCPISKRGVEKVKTSPSLGKPEPCWGVGGLGGVGGRPYWRDSGKPEETGTWVKGLTLIPQVRRNRGRSYIR